MSHLASVPELMQDKYFVLLSREETLFLSTPEATGYGSWAGTNASIVAEETFRYRNEYNTLRVQPLVAGTGAYGNTEFSLTHENKIVDPVLVGDRLACHVFVYPIVEMEVSIDVEDSNGLSTSTPYVSIPPLVWTLVKSDSIPVTEQTATLRAFATINFRSDTSLNHAHIAHPVLTNVYGFTDNLFLRECMSYIPRFLTETDEAQENPKFPMYRFMDLGVSYADVAYRQVEEFRYRDIASGYDATDDTTKSTLVDPEVAGLEYLPWLGQFVGVTRKTSRAGATPWGNLPETWEEIHTSIDPDADVTYYISSIGSAGASLTATPSGFSEGDTVSVAGTTNFNGQYQITSISGNEIVLDPVISEPDEFTGSVTLVDTSWLEIEFFDTQDSNYENAQRNLVSTARTGHNAGTKQAIIDTLEQVLLGTKWYSYEIDPFNSPWVISIQTLATETPGGVVGSESLLVMEQLETVKPMGFVIAHECVDLDLLYEEPGVLYDSGAPYDGYT